MRTAVDRLTGRALSLIATGPRFAAGIIAYVDWQSCVDRHSYAGWQGWLLVASAAPPGCVRRRRSVSSGASIRPNRAQAHATT